MSESAFEQDDYLRHATMRQLSIRGVKAAEVWGKRNGGVSADDETEKPNHHGIVPVSRDFPAQLTPRLCFSGSAPNTTQVRSHPLNVADASGYSEQGPG